ncbi:MAG: winged helix DNA-binding domain-containing protein [Microlunatus sp.]|nr:winged helix DNA-binding domain-containing protein [Microlunatus sp.]
MERGDVAAELSWDRALMWRLRRQSLIERAPRTRWPAVVGNLGGVHAQVLSAAVASIAARVDTLGTDDVARALWSERSLVKLWAMRGTLHLLSAADHGTWTAALAATYPTAYGHYRMADPEVVELAVVIGELLRDRLLTRRELAAELRGTRPAAQLELLTSSWGNGLKPASFLGLLCHGPPLDGRSRFTRPPDLAGAGGSALRPGRGHR